MPWRPIQTNTAGFLSLLGLKNLGKNPDAIQEIVQPTISMEGYWLRGAAVPVIADLTLTQAAGRFESAPFSAGPYEWIYIHYATAFYQSAGTPTGTDEGIALRVVNQLNRQIWGTPYESWRQTNGGIPVFAAIEVRDLWIPPGYTLAIDYDAAIGDLVTLSGLVTRANV